MIRRSRSNRSEENSFLLRGKKLNSLWLLLLLLQNSCTTAKQSSNSTLPTVDSTDVKDVKEGVFWLNVAALTSCGKHILLPCSGFVENGHVCGVLGPSGSGKSSLLSIIAGRPDRTLQVSGTVRSFVTNASSGGDETQLEPIYPDQVAWLQQHDSFFEQLTVKETIALASFLELPHLSASEREVIAQANIDALGLSNVQHRPVGRPGSPGAACLSGGERRRLSLALELVTDKSLFVADEPTSGLDSSMSERVVKIIKALAREKNIPSFCILHQPRSSIWHLLDSIILMAPGGRIAYMGSREQAISHFASLGYNCPEQTNPAEFFVDLVSIDTENITKAASDEARIQYLAQNLPCNSEWPIHAALKLQGEETTNVGKFKRTNLLVSLVNKARRFGALFKRSWRQNFRDTALNLFRLFSSVGTSLLLSQIFPTVKKGTPTTKSVADRIALLSFGVITMCMTAFMKTIDLFSKEKPVVLRERSRNQYTSLEYILSKAVAELPLDVSFAVVFSSTLKVCTGVSIDFFDLAAIFSLMTVTGASLGFFVGSIMPSQESAVAAGIPVMIVLMVVGIINPSGVDPESPPPAFIEYVKKASPFASAIQALCLNEFDGMEFQKHSPFHFGRLKDLPRMGGLALVKNGKEILEALGLQDMQYITIMKHMVALSIVNLGLSWLCMTLLNQANKGWKRVDNVDDGFAPKTPHNPCISQEGNRAVIFTPKIVT